MKKSYFAVLIGAAALADAANALNPTQTMEGSTLKLFVAAGESLELITGIRTICEPNTEDQFSNVPDHRQWGASYSATWEDLKAIERLFSWSCRIRTDAPSAYAALRGRNVAVFFSRERGLDGVYFDAVSQYDGHNRTPMRFMAPSAATCTTANNPGYVPLHWCSGTQLQRPLLGVAEVGPETIRSVNTVYTAESVTWGYFIPPEYYPNLGLDSGIFKLYGIAASAPLYRAMQASQGLPATEGRASRPSISTIEAVGFYSGFSADWGWLLGRNHARRHDQINWCLPRNGSGVKAVASHVFLEFPRNYSFYEPLNSGWNASETLRGLAGIAVGNGTPYTFHVVDDADTERGVEECLATASARGAFALGLLSVGRFAETAELPWKMLKIDGVEPHRDDAKTGRYPFITGTKLVWNSRHLSTVEPALQQLVQGYGALWKDPWLHAPANNPGVLLPLTDAFGSGSVAEQSLMAAMYDILLYPKILGSLAPADGSPAAVNNPSAQSRARGAAEGNAAIKRTEPLVFNKSLPRLKAAPLPAAPAVR